MAAAAAGVSANVVFGASSLYWRLLAGIAPTTLVGYRILISLTTLLAILWLTGRLRALRSKLGPRVLALHVAASCLVVVNWAVFICHGHVVETGLGYLTAPCISIAAGVIVFREKVDKVVAAALLVIAAAIALLLLRSGELQHWLYLTAAISWGGYACLKRFTPLDAVSGLLMETVFLSIGCGLALMFSDMTLALPAGMSTLHLAALAMAGLVSAIPLMLFSYAANHLSLSMNGLLQFVLPTTQFIVATFVYRQPVSANTVIALSLIWLALMAIVARPLLLPRCPASAGRP
ncbi:EamA family transporter [Cupriavidus sp. H18C1]|uniref:EamA family transporter n=1 Tax=Cupriavidus sp. H18C1 TaxID=3241601 RepID=UPI003BB97AA0